MAEMSQMSEMSIVEPAPAEPGEQKGPSVKVIAMAIVVLLLLLFLIYSVIQASSESIESEGDGDGDGDGGGQGYSGGGRRKTTTTTTTTETTVKAATPKPHERPLSFIFCTVGPSMESAHKVTSVPICDFIVYTDVVVYDSKIGAYDDPVSYEAFLELAQKYQGYLAWQGYPYPDDEEEKLRQFGISFSANDLDYLDVSLRSVRPGDLWKTYGILTAGLASYSRGAVASDSTNVNKLKSIISNIDRMLQTARSGNTTVLKTIFLGVKLAGTTTSSQYDAAAMNELKSIPKIDVLILITHLLRPEPGNKCAIQPLSRYSGDVQDVAAPPTMKRVIPLVNKSMPFSVAVSLTMSVFLFEPKGGLKATTAFGDKCNLYYPLDFSEVCHANQKDIKLSNKLESSATAPKDKVFMVFETVISTRSKVQEAIKQARKRGVALVWAVYDVQNDAASCKGSAKPNQPSYERFAVVRELMDRDYKDHAPTTTTTTKATTKATNTTGKANSTVSKSKATRRRSFRLAGARNITRRFPGNQATPGRVVARSQN